MHGSSADPHLSPSPPAWVACLPWSSDQSHADCAWIGPCLTGASGKGNDPQFFRLPARSPQPPLC